MPWTVDDVDSHKKGLSAAGKKKWVATANGVLADCMKAGGAEKTCAAKAIRIANGTVNSNENYAIYKVITEENYKVQVKTHQKKKHLVVPVVMMVEGVHNGSHGPLLHLIEDLGEFPEAWNGIPIVVNHPEDEEGQNISANSPEIIDEECAGRVYNTHVDGLKLRAEAWLEEEKLIELSEEAYEAITNNEPLEVSIGVFSKDEMINGQYEGKKYTAIARGHRPDHLALLPGGTGACSLEDGCGIRANRKNKKGGNNVKKNVNEMIETLSLAGYAINQIGDHAEQGFRELMDLVYNKLRTLETDDSYCYLEEMYDDELIYSKSMKSEPGMKMFKQDYKIESGKIEFIGDPVEVRKKVEYVLNTIQRTKFSTNHKKEVKMAKDDCPKCLEKINKLLANKESGFDETDRAWLEALTEPQLDKAITPKVIKETVEKEKTIQVDKLAPEDQAALAFGKRLLKERREKMTKVIQVNVGKEVWPDEKLKAMDDDTLERVFNSVKKEEVVDYSLSNGGTDLQDNEEVEPMLPGSEEPEKTK